MAKVSVIIPVYNVEKYIRECLDSVVNQTLTDIEIIVVNDGTPDGSAVIAREYAARDPRIVMIDQSNGGLSAARNTGMAAATAPFVMFVDSDDAVEPDYCRKAYEAMTDTVDAAVCGARLIDEAGKTLKDKNDYFVVPPRGDNMCAAVAWNKIFRMSIIREHGIAFPSGLLHEDEYFWNVYLPWCRDIAYVPDKLYLYRQRAGSIISAIMVDRGNVRPDILHVLALLGDYYDKHGLMQNDKWAAHYWKLFDSFVWSSQIYRPERFRRSDNKKKKNRIREWLKSL